MPLKNSIQAYRRYQLPGYEAIQVLNQARRQSVVLTHSAVCSLGSLGHPSIERASARAHVCTDISRSLTVSLLPSLYVCTLVAPTASLSPAVDDSMRPHHAKLAGRTRPQTFSIEASITQDSWTRQLRAHHRLVALSRSALPPTSKRPCRLFLLTDVSSELDVSSLM